MKTGWLAAAVDFTDENMGGIDSRGGFCPQFLLCERIAAAQKKAQQQNECKLAAH